MRVLVIGGTRFFGIHTVNALLQQGHDVTFATRGNSKNIIIKTSLLFVIRLLLE